MTTTHTKRCMFEECERPFSARGMCKLHYMRWWWRQTELAKGREPVRFVWAADVLDIFEVSDNEWLTIQQVHDRIEVHHPGRNLSATRRLVQRMITDGTLEKRRAPPSRCWPSPQTIQVRSV